MMITLEKIINLAEMIPNSKGYVKQVKIGCWNKSRAKVTNICFKKRSFQVSIVHSLNDLYGDN